MFSTPPLRTRQSSSPSIGTPSTPTNYNRTLDSRRKALGTGGNRDRGTPVGRLLADEGMMGIRSPRKVRTRNLTEKLKDYPSNFLLSIETSISLIEFDLIGYPLAILFNLIHLLTRFSIFTAKIPNWKDLTRIGNRMGDADARLEYLRKKSLGDNNGWKAATILSIILVLISIINTVYLYTRKRRYHLMLRQDPLSSPNASSSTLDFSAPRPKSSILQSIKRKALNLIWSNQESTGTILEIQQLDVWTPDYVKWSLRLFSLYPPPISIMYHFLTPSNFFPFMICGTLLVFQNFLLITSYTQLLADRQTLQAEVMHEYNSKFVNPRIFVQKRDMGTSTNEAEFVGFRNGNDRIWNSGRDNSEERGSVRRSSVGVGASGGSRISRNQIPVGSPRKSLVGTPKRAQPVESEEEEEDRDEEEESEEEDDDEEELERQRQLEKEKLKIRARRQRESIAASQNTASPGVTASGRKRRS